MSKEIENHTNCEMQAVIRFLDAQNAWDISVHPPYSLDLTPSDFHLFTHLKQFLGSTRMVTSEEVKKAVKDWFSGLAVGFYNAGIHTPITRYDKCLNHHGDYVEK
jgi:histone-lysine N-methyltransferase SETMAR